MPLRSRLIRKAIKNESLGDLKNLLGKHTFIAFLTDAGEPGRSTTHGKMLLCRVVTLGNRVWSGRCCHVITTPFNLLQALRFRPSAGQHVATELGSGPVFLGDLRKQSAEDSQHLKDWISRYTRLRSSVAITDSFFPLGSWRQPRVDQWDGFARLAKSGEGLIVVFKNESAASNASIQILGFPDGQFKMTSWGDGSPIAVQGRAIREGIVVPLQERETANVFELHRD